MFIRYNEVGYDVRFWLYLDDIEGKVIGKLVINDHHVDKFELKEWDKVDYLRGLFENKKLFIYDVLMLAEILPDTIKNPWSYLNIDDVIDRLKQSKTPEEKNNKDDENE